jgi:penicillin-binding protein 2
MITEPDYIPDLRRLKAMYAIFVVFFALIIARLWYLQIAQGPELLEQSKEQRTRLIRRVAPRGIITDAKGRVLATNRPEFVVSILPDELKKNPDVLPRLAQLLQISPEELQQIIADNKTTPFDPVPLLRDADIQILSQIEEQRLELPGVLISKDPKREYTDNQLCTHVLGLARPISAENLRKMRDKDYRGGDYFGEMGIEASYEEMLHGKAGGQVVEVDARGRMIRTVDERPSLPGHTLRLTLDLDLQRVAYEGLREQLNKGRPGAVVALDPNDGAVLAMVSTPTYDLNRFGKDYGKLSTDKQTPMINRATQSAYPCGSPFKLVTAAAGLETGTTSRYTGDYCPGYIKAGRWRFNCDVRSGHGSIGFRRAIAASCNVFFWHTAERAGRDAVIEWTRRFGVGERTGIDLPPSMERKGRVPTPEWKRKTGRGPWVRGDLLNMAIGQGYVELTPLQLANFTAALGNGGFLLRPQLVREIKDTSGTQPRIVKRLKREVRSVLGLKPENLAAIQEGMRGVLERGGTAAAIQIPGLTIAGKTGTAETFIRGEKKDNSFFVCYAPAQNPKIALAVFVEGGGFGAQTAAPIARRMLMQYFNLNRPTEIASYPPRQRARRFRR